MGLSLDDAKRVGLAHLHPANAPVAAKPKPVPEVVAKASRPEADAMNGTERRYAELLETQRRNGEILRWDFESVKLRLADLTYYTPDFRVILLDGTEEFHEVKGFWRDDARIKIKVAAEQHPYRFVAVSLVKKEWKREVFQGKQR